MYNSVEIYNLFVIIMIVRIKDFVSSDGKNYIKEWYRKKLTMEYQFKLDRLIDILSKKKPPWDPRDYKTLSGKQAVLGEIRLRANPPIRIAGIFRENRSEFVLLIGFTHKGKIYTPPEALDTALARKKLLESNKGGTVDHEFYDDDEVSEE